MEKKWPSELLEVKLKNFTVEYDPCVDCMTMDYDDPVAVRLVKSNVCKV